MKKKLLTILLSIFVIISAFTTRVFAASYQTVGEIVNLATDIPTMSDSSIPDGAWANGNGGYLVKVGEFISFTHADNASPYTIHVSNNVTDNGGGSYEYTDYYIYVVFTVSSDTLVNVTVSGLTNPYESLNGEYTAPSASKTIADFIPDNFPYSVTSGWGGSSTNTRLFQNLPSKDSLYINKQNGTDSYIILKNKNVTRVTDNQYKYHNSEAGKEFDIFFNLESGVLQSIVITGATGDLGGINDTYTEPVKLADIIPSNFPTDNTSAWTNGIHYIYLVGDEIKLNGSINVLDLDGAVRPVGDGNYHFTDSLGTMTFIMDGDKFTSIVASGFVSPYDTANGTYSAPVTIESLLDTVNNFPVTESSGWVKENNSTTNRVYIDGANLMIGSSSFPLNGILTKEGNDYKYTSGMVIIKFIMGSSVLNKINFTVMSGTASGDYVPYKYEIEQTSSIPKGSTQDLVFKTNGVYTNDTDVEVKLNDQPLDLGTHYTVEHGSIKVTLLGSYIKDLAPGPYTISIGVLGSFDPLTSQFTIAGSSPSPAPDPTPRYNVPNTGVEGMPTNNYSLLKVSSLSLLAIGTYLVIKKKKDN